MYSIEFETAAESLAKPFVEEQQLKKQNGALGSNALQDFEPWTLSLTPYTRNHKHSRRALTSSNTNAQQY